MPRTTEAIAFTDSYKHMEMPGWNDVTEFSNGYFVYLCNAGYPS